MKYISLIVFVAALIWTWHLVNRESVVSFETHSGNQEKLGNLITETIKTKRPNASEIKIQKIWTEAVDENHVKAFFIYTFKDNSDAGLVTSEIKGEGLLEHQPADGSGNDRWSLTKVHTSNDAIQFDEALIISGSASGAPENATPAPTEEHK